jgi:molybdopterin synthase sulfur carrier subunit
MRIRVLFFASLADTTGTPGMPFDASEPSTVGSLLGELAARFPALNSYKGTILSAVNSAYAPRDTPLSDGDEVAFFPPVSGG